jgi:NADPH-dependent F420 reductase
LPSSSPIEIATICDSVGVHVGILGGTGPAGRGVAARLSEAGVQITLGSRDSGRAQDIAREVKLKWTTRELAIEGSDNESAAQADVVIIATPWDSAISTVKPLATSLEDKVVISMANALIKEGREMLALIPPRGSVAATLQSVLPRSMVAAAFHHLPASEMEDLESGLEADVLVCSDYPEATTVTMDLTALMRGLRPLNAGSLSQASAIEAFTAVCITLNIRHKAHSTLRMVGI